MTILIDIFIIGLLIFTLLLAVTAIAHIWVSVPYVPTPMKVVHKMVEMADLRGKETVYDLGAGDGRLVVAAKKEHPDIRAIGIEFVPTVWALGKAYIWYSKQEVEFVCGNVLKRNVSDADCIFLYLIPGLMDKLEKKFDEELKKGTKVISYAFRFKGRTPVKKIQVPWLGSTRYLNLYEW